MDERERKRRQSEVNTLNDWPPLRGLVSTSNTRNKQTSKKGTKTEKRLLPWYDQSKSESKTNKNTPCLQTL
jgi:hypothetical protein